MFVFASMRAPAARMRTTMVASRRDMKPSNRAEP